MCYTCHNVSKPSPSHLRNCFQLLKSFPPNMTQLSFLHRLLSVFGVFHFHIDLKKNKNYCCSNSIIIVCSFLIFTLRLFSCFKFLIEKIHKIHNNVKEFINSSFLTTIIFFFDDCITVALTLMINVNVFLRKNELVHIVSAIHENEINYRVRALTVTLIICSVIHIAVIAFENNLFSDNNGVTRFSVNGFILNLMVQGIYVLYETVIVLTIQQKIKELRNKFNNVAKCYKLIIQFDQIFEIFKLYEISFIWTLIMRKLNAFASFMILLYTMEEFTAQGKFETRYVLHFISEIFWDLPQLVTIFYIWSVGFLENEVLDKMVLLHWSIKRYRYTLNNSR